MLEAGEKLPEEDWEREARPKRARTAGQRRQREEPLPTRNPPKTFTGGFLTGFLIIILPVWLIFHLLAFIGGMSR
jgi:hypothetical protein